MIKLGWISGFSSHTSINMFRFLCTFLKLVKLRFFSLVFQSENWIYLLNTYKARWTLTLLVLNARDSVEIDVDDEHLVDALVGWVVCRLDLSNCFWRWTNRFSRWTKRWVFRVKQWGWMFLHELVEVRVLREVVELHVQGEHVCFFCACRCAGRSTVRSVSPRSRLAIASCASVYVCWFLF